MTTINTYKRSATIYKAIIHNFQSDIDSLKLSRRMDNLKLGSNPQ
jgi:hypothetical protein